MTEPTFIKDRQDQPCPFGYWVGPGGEIYGIEGWQQHSEMASAILESGVLSLGTEPFFNLSSLGWISVTVNQHLATPSFSLPAEITPALARALLRIVQWHSPSMFYVTHEECDPIEAGRRIKRAVGT